MTTTIATDSKPAERWIGELYRDEPGNEVWRIREVATGRVVNEGIASDSDYLWLLDHKNGCEYADQREAARDAGAYGTMP